MTFTLQWKLLVLLVLSGFWYLGSHIHYIIFSFLQVCGTDGASADPNKPCVFPFIYGGKSYDKCTTEGHDQPWCSTKVNAGGYHIDGNWGNCDSNCAGGNSCFVLFHWALSTDQ